LDVLGQQKEIIISKYIPTSVYFDTVSKYILYGNLLNIVSCKQIGTGQVVIFCKQSDTQVLLGYFFNTFAQQIMGDKIALRNNINILNEIESYFRMYC
jgi:hypothetical protein